MTVWISRRPEADVGNELAESRSGPGLLAGIRLAVSDDIDVAGRATTAGCSEFADIPDSDAAAVAALRAEGAVLVGKTNLDQFATAVAVATGETDIAVSTDTAGSGLVAAGLQGIVGIKPTRSVISHDDGVPTCESYDCSTIFAPGLRLADTATAVLAASAPGRSWPADTTLAASSSPVVAIPDELPHLDRQWRAAFDEAVTRLQACGVRIVTVGFAPFLAAAKLGYDGALASERYSAITQFIDVHPAVTLDPTVRDIIAAARDIPAHRLIAERTEVRRLQKLAMKSLAGAAALLVPTAPTHPSIAEVEGDPVGVNERLGTYTDFCNLFDMCGVAVPAGTAGDAQFGVTVLARAFDDAVALDIAALFTDEPAPAMPWPLAAADHVELVVFGAHLLGGPLVHQLTDRGARFAGEITTAPRYRMTALPTTPPKPGVTRVPEGVDGAALTGHRWLLSPAALGRFLAELPAPMQLGKVEFADGSWRTAFGCDAAVPGEDISSHGSWTNALAAGAVRQA